MTGANNAITSTVIQANTDLTAENKKLRKAVESLQKQLQDSSVAYEKLKIESTKELIKWKTRVGPHSHAENEDLLAKIEQLTKELRFEKNRSATTSRLPTYGSSQNGTGVFYSGKPPVSSRSVYTPRYTQSIPSRSMSADRAQALASERLSRSNKTRGTPSSASIGRSNYGPSGSHLETLKGQRRSTTPPTSRGNSRAGSPQTAKNNNVRTERYAHTSSKKSRFGSQSSQFSVLTISTAGILKNLGIRRRRRTVPVNVRLVYVVVAMQNLRCWQANGILPAGLPHEGLWKEWTAGQCLEKRKLLLLGRVRSILRGLPKLMTTFCGQWTR
jgi:hypothetical protein